MEPERLRSSRTRCETRLREQEIPGHEQGSPVEFHAQSFSLAASEEALKAKRGSKSGWVVEAPRKNS